MTKRPGSRTTGVVPENKKVAEWKNSTQSPVDNDSDGHNSDENEWFCNQTTIEAIEKHREETYAGGWLSTELGIDLPKKDEKRKKYMLTITARNRGLSGIGRASLPIEGICQS